MHWITVAAPSMFVETCSQLFVVPHPRVDTLTDILQMRYEKQRSAAALGVKLGAAQIPVFWHRRDRVNHNDPAM
jgi:hypothetical protein